MREATDRHFHLLISTESNTDTINIREPFEASKIEMKRKWQGIPEEDDISEDTQSEEDITDEELSDAEDLAIAVETSEDVQLLLGELISTLDILQDTFKSHLPGLVSSLNSIITAGNSLMSQVTQQWQTHTNTTRSGR